MPQKSLDYGDNSLSLRTALFLNKFGKKKKGSDLDRTSFLPAFNLRAQAGANSFKAALPAPEELSIPLAHFAASIAAGQGNESAS